MTVKAWLAGLAVPAALLGGFQCDSAGTAAGGSSGSGGGPVVVFGPVPVRAPGPGTWVRVSKAKGVQKVWAWRKVGAAAAAAAAGTYLGHAAKSAVEGSNPCDGRGPGYIAASFPSSRSAVFFLDCGSLHAMLGADGTAPLTDVYDCIAVTIAKGSSDGRAWAYRGNKVITSGRHITAVFLPHNIVSVVTWHKCATG